MKIRKCKVHRGEGFKPVLGYFHGFFTEERHQGTLGDPLKSAVAIVEVRKSGQVLRVDPSDVEFTSKPSPQDLA